MSNESVNKLKKKLKEWASEQHESTDGTDRVISEQEAGCSLFLKFLRPAADVPLNESANKSVNRSLKWTESNHTSR